MQFIDLKTQYEKLKKEIDVNISSVLNSNQYMMGDFIKQLERSLAEYVGTKYCITCANGTDALQLALMAWNIKKGDAVFVPSFTFYATAEVVSLLGATPIFIDSDSQTFNMDAMKLEKAIKDILNTSELKPKAVIPVDLFGLPADYENIKKIATKYDLKILEDGAQGFGGSYQNRKACSFGDISTTSFFPAKPLGCYGDGGAIFTDNIDYYDILKSLRIHGKGSFKYDNIRIGLNSRLDNIQAAILLPKLKAFSDYELKDRNEIAKEYTKKLHNYATVPYIPKNTISSYAQYTILLENEETRNSLKECLHEKGIPSMIYYPKPLHKQTVYKDYNFNLNELNVAEDLSKRCLSLPMHPYLRSEQIDFICQSVIKELLVIRSNG